MNSSQNSQEESMFVINVDEVQINCCIKCCLNLQYWL